MDDLNSTSAMDAPGLLLSVIVPARNEADVLPACLASLLKQSDPALELGRDWELLLVNDGSTDGTAALAAEAATLEGVTLLDAPPLDETSQGGFTGKNNACWTGAQAARGRLLLFTDADTIHEPGALSRARHELEKHSVSLLSYSPRQVTSGLLQRLLMPLIFAELAIAYPPARVNAPEDRTAAANGQFLMVVAEDYFAVGGHRAVGLQVLEDVALANLFKRSRRSLRFRYAPDALSARMYRSTGALMEGWTKNLALLFRSPTALGLLRLLDFLLILGIPVIAQTWPLWTSLQRTLFYLVWARVLWRFYARVAKSHFPFLDCALSLLGVPLFVFLLFRSFFRVRVAKSIGWKGRTYSTARQ